MAGLFGLSVSSCVETNFFTDVLYWGTFYNKHLGEEYCGLAGGDRHFMRSDARRGLFSSNFKDKMEQFRNGLNGIGYCGSALEPFFAKRSKFGPFALCFTGNIINIKDLIENFDEGSHLFERADEAEVIAKLIVKEESFFEGIESLVNVAEGAWSLLILTNQGVYVARSPCGRWPLVIGQHKHSLATCVSSEQTGFNNLSFEVERYIDPGEIVFIGEGRVQLTRQMKSTKIRECSFNGVYTSSPAAVVNGMPATLIRKKLGALLAKRDIKNGLIPHIVLPVPDSGRFHAIGYHQEFCLQMMKGSINTIPIYQEPLIKYWFSRSFLKPSIQEREKTAELKIVATAENLNHFLRMLADEGLERIRQDIIERKRIIIVVCDDSVVRGTQIKSNLAPKLRMSYESGEIKAEIHVRVSFPEILSHCVWGKTTKKGETLAEIIPDKKKRAEALGVESVFYNTLDDLEQALQVPLRNLCIACAIKKPV